MLCQGETFNLNEELSTYPRRVKTNNFYTTTMFSTRDEVFHRCPKVLVESLTNAARLDQFVGLRVAPPWNPECSRWATTRD
jgi:hypothetical protein